MYEKIEKELKKKGLHIDREEIKIEDGGDIFMNEAMIQSSLNSKYPTDS